MTILRFLTLTTDRTRSRRAGFTTLEVCGGVAIGALILASLVSQSDFFARFNKSLVAARYQRQFAEAALRYWDTNPGQTVNSGNLIASGLLPAAFPSYNSYGQTLLGCQNPAQGGYIVAATGEVEINVTEGKYVKSFLGPNGGFQDGGTVCGTTAKNSAYIKLLSTRQLDDQAYLARAGGQMHTTLRMGSNDIRNAGTVNTKHIDAAQAVFTNLNSDGLGITTALSATNFSISGVTTVKTSATANLVNVTNLSVTNNTAVAGELLFNNTGFVPGADCRAYGTGAITTPSPNDRSRGALYCDRFDRWQEVSHMNYRYVQSPKDISTTQTAYCAANEIVISGGGIAYGSYDENITAQSDTGSTETTRVYDPHYTLASTVINPSGSWQSSTSMNPPNAYRSCQDNTPSSGQQTCRTYEWRVWRNYTQNYTRWTLRKGSNSTDGNIKGNLRESYPVFNTRDGVWGWRVVGTHPTFREGEKSAARAVCLCLGNYDAKTGCTLLPSQSVPKTITQGSSQNVLWNEPEM